MIRKLKLNNEEATGEVEQNEIEPTPPRKVLNKQKGLTVEVLPMPKKSQRRLSSAHKAKNDQELLDTLKDIGSNEDESVDLSNKSKTLKKGFEEKF